MKRIPLYRSKRSLSGNKGSKPVPTPSDDTQFTRPMPIMQGEGRLSILARCNEKARSRPLRILLVEDELALCHVLVEFLRGESFEVETASDGIEALQKFRDGHFDLVVSDRSLPNLNGDDLASLIKTIQPDEPVILMSALSADGCGSRVPSGANYTLGKPFALSTLRRAIEWVTAIQPPRR